MASDRTIQTFKIFIRPGHDQGEEAPSQATGPARLPNPPVAASLWVQGFCCTKGSLGSEASGAAAQCEQLCFGLLSALSSENTLTRQSFLLLPASSYGQLHTFPEFTPELFFLRLDLDACQALDYLSVTDGTVSLPKFTC